jgi:hypothetical protein
MADSPSSRHEDENSAISNENLQNKAFRELQTVDHHINNSNPDEE